MSDEEGGEEGDGEGEEGGEVEGGVRSEGESDYNYLLSLSLWSLTLEKKEELLKKRDEKVCSHTQKPQSYMSYMHCGCVLSKPLWLYVYSIHVHVYVFRSFYVFLIYVLSVSLLVCYAHDFPCIH